MHDAVGEWVWVPREPTHAMFEAGDWQTPSFSQDDPERAARVWRAMVAAAPSRAPEASGLREWIDSPILLAAREMTEEQRGNPEWLWFNLDNVEVSFSRWSNRSNQAPYIRADLALREINDTRAEIEADQDDSTDPITYTLRAYTTDGQGVVALTACGDKVIATRVENKGASLSWKGSFPDLFKALSDTRAETAQNAGGGTWEEAWQERIVSALKAAFRAGHSFGEDVSSISEWGGQPPKRDKVFTEWLSSDGQEEVAALFAPSARGEG